MAVKNSGRYVILCGFLGVLTLCMPSSGKAWSGEFIQDPLPFADSPPVPFSSERPVLDTTLPEKRFQALYNWRMTEKKSVSMGVMVRQDPVYLNNNTPNGIAIFRYRVKF